MESAQGSAPNTPSPDNNSPVGEVAASQAQKSVEKKPTPDRYKVPIDGREIEVDIEELKRGYSHASAAAKRMQEAAEIRKAEQARRERALKGDMAWLTEMGVPEDQLIKWAEKRILESIEYEQLPDHEKELRKAKSERERLEKELAQLKQKDREAFEAQLAEKAAAEIDAEIAQALQSYQGKKTPRLVRRVAEAMYAHLEKNNASLPSSKAFEIAKKSITEDVQEYLNNAPTSEWLKSLSKEQMSALRAHFVDEAKAQAPFARQAERREMQQAPTKKREKITTDEWFDRIENRLNKKRG